MISDTHSRQHLTGPRYSDKLAFHDADTDTVTDSDSPDTSVGLHSYVRYTLFPREDPHEEIACVGRKM